MTQQGWNIEARFRVWGPNGVWIPQADYLNLPQEDGERKAAELTVSNTLSEWRAVPTSEARPA